MRAKDTRDAVICVHMPRILLDRYLFVRLFLPFALSGSAREPNERSRSDPCRADLDGNRYFYEFGMKGASRLLLLIKYFRTIGV
jgi:hypothetical protein